MTPRRLTFSIFAAAAIATAAASLAADIETHFSPRGDCAATIIAELGNAKATADLCLYQLSYPPIITAIHDAAARGVMVRICIDAGVEYNTPKFFNFLRVPNVTIRTDRNEKLQHNKYAIIDGYTIITGSFNWSENGQEHNAENLVVFHDHKTAGSFAADFQTHWAHSADFIARPPKKKNHAAPATSPQTITNRPPTKEP